MAYNETLAQRIQEILVPRTNFIEKKMFGGVGFMIGGNMACGVHKDYLIVRVGPEDNDEALSHPHTKPFDITGRPMQGWVMVSSEGYQDDMVLENWVLRGVKFTSSLPSK